MEYSLHPWLNVTDGSRALAFYRAAFGAVESYRLEAPDGSLVLRLSVGGAEFWVSGGPESSAGGGAVRGVGGGSAAGESGPDSGSAGQVDEGVGPLGESMGPLGGNSVRMILTVPDPDLVFAQAIAAGAVEVFPVGEEHGWRLGRLVDPFGLHWEVGRQVGR